MSSCEHRDVVDGRCLDCGEELHSWRPSSLIALAANPPEPPTIGGLLYPGKRGVLSGETEANKTWGALILAKAEMEIGYPVGWADLDAMGSGELLERLRALEVPDPVIDELFAYYEPSDRLVGDLLDEVCHDVAERGVRLFVVDAFTGILSLHGLDPGSSSDIETFWREVATPIARAGAAPTILDHVVKDEGSRGKYSTGSERKASGAHVHIGFRAVGEQFTRGGSGASILRTHKDRPGFLPRPTVGRLELVSDGVSVTYSLVEDRSRSGDKFRPTVLMQRISETLEAETERRSQTWIEQHVTGNVPTLRTALDVLVDERFVERDDTARGTYHTSIRPYREEDDERLQEQDAETPSIPRPYPVPSLRSSPTSEPRPPVPSLRGTGSGSGVDRDGDPVHNPVPGPGSQWTTLAYCGLCGEEKAARVAAGVTQLICGHPARDPEIPF